MVNRTHEVGSGTPCYYKQRDFAREYDQKTTVHVFSKQTIHNMLLRFLIVLYCIVCLLTLHKGTKSYGYKYIIVATVYIQEPNVG